MTFPQQFANFLICIWLFKEYDFVLADLNISVFTTLCCQVVAIWRYRLLSYLTSDHRSEPINFYILVPDRHDLTLSIISYLLSDRRSDANTILNIICTFHYIKVTIYFEEVNRDTFNV